MSIMNLMARMEEEMPNSLRRTNILMPSVDESSFRAGFICGAAWEWCQAEDKGSSQAVGNISQYPAAVEEPEEEA